LAAVSAKETAIGIRTGSSSSFSSIVLSFQAALPAHFSPAQPDYK